MYLKNDTTVVSIEKSVSHIENRLSGYNAAHVIKQYNEGNLEAIIFTLMVNGKGMSFKLQAKIDECEKILLSQIKRPRKSTEKRIKKQAGRMAWKLVSDCLDIQLTMVSLGQKELLEIFLSDIYDSKTKQTFFEKVRDEVRLLGDGNG